MSQISCLPGCELGDKVELTRSLCCLGQVGMVGNIGSPGSVFQIEVTDFSYHLFALGSVWKLLEYNLELGVLECLGIDPSPGFALVFFRPLDCLSCGHFEALSVQWGRHLPAV